MICETCGWVLRVGDWPFCGRGRDHAPAVANIITDDIPGGQVIENLGHDPLTFYSKQAIVAEADKRGLRLRDQWAGPHDQYLTNWAASIDAQTLENARALVSRGTRAQGEDATRLQTVTTSVREVTAWP